MLRIPCSLRRSPPLAAAVLLLAAGCATQDRLVLTAPQMAELAQRRGVDPQAVPYPFALDEEMRAWVDEHVERRQTFEHRLDSLLAALMSPQGKSIRYRGGTTGTAREVFEDERANCLGFTGLFVAMARELGVPTYFLYVDEVESFTREGDLVVVSHHVSAGFGTLERMKILELGDGEPTSYRAIRRISDLTAVALFYSNRGAELLQAGRSEAALRTLENAAAIDPSLALSWTNLGVARRRNGDLDGAELAYRQALARDPESVTTYQNLASLLRLRGDQLGAEAMMARLSTLGGRNPYNYLNLGDWAMARGELREAGRWYRKARHLQRDAPEPLAALGLWALAAGDREAAERWLERARRLDPDEPRVRQLAAKL